MRYLIIGLLALSVVACGSEDEVKIKAEAEAEATATEAEALTMRQGVYQVTLEDGTTERWVHLPGSLMRLYRNGQNILVPLNGDGDMLSMSSTVVAKDVFTGKLWNNLTDPSAVYISHVEGCYVD